MSTATLNDGITTRITPKKHFCWKKLLKIHLGERKTSVIIQNEYFFLLRKSIWFVREWVLKNFYVYGGSSNTHHLKLFTFEWIFKKSEPFCMDFVFWFDNSFYKIHNILRESHKMKLFITWSVGSSKSIFVQLFQSHFIDDFLIGSFNTSLEFFSCQYEV